MLLTRIHSNVARPTIQGGRIPNQRKSYLDLGDGTPPCLGHNTRTRGGF